MPFAAGQTLSFYEILGPIGTGAMGEVYRAKDTRLGREVAIKVLPEHFADDPERLVRFEREARLLASLNHPNIAQIHGFERIGDTCLLALEPASGDDPQPQRPRRVVAAADLGIVINSDNAGLVGRGLSPDGSRFLIGRSSPADPRAGIFYFRNFRPAHH